MEDTSNKNDTFPLNESEDIMSGYVRSIPTSELDDIPINNSNFINVISSSQIQAQPVCCTPYDTIKMTNDNSKALHIITETDNSRLTFSSQQVDMDAVIANVTERSKICDVHALNRCIQLSDGDDNDVINTVHNIPIKRKEIKRLSAPARNCCREAWLNDEIINAYVNFQFFVIYQLDLCNVKLDPYTLNIHAHMFFF
jgi:hypothetical protein